MAARFSRLLTVTTVVLMAALLLTMIVERLLNANLGQWSNALVWGLVALVLIRLLTRVGSWRSRIAGPLAGSMSVQSRMLGFTPGSSAIDHSSGPAYTISEVEDEESSRRLRDGEAH